jgi:hypothetical protein
MAKKKRAKKKNISSVKQRREQDVRYQNVFLDKLRNLCIQIEDVSLFHQIPMLEKTLLYLFRGAPLKVVAAEGTKIPKRLLDGLIKIIKSQQLSMEMEVVAGSGKMMTFADYFLVGHALEYVMSKEDTVFPGKERFDNFLASKDTRMEIYGKGVDRICDMACWVFSDLEKNYLYTYTFDFSLAKVRGSIQDLHKIDCRIHQKVIIGTYPLEVRKVSIDGETHSGIPLGGVYPKGDEQIFNPLCLSIEDLHIDTPFSKLKLPIYIQQHAIMRMKERIGAALPCFYKGILVHGLTQKEYVPIAKNRFLMATFSEELKIGYFVVEIVEGIVLIRTFLLLTNGGTPEGDKLAKLTGLQTDDRKYLAIDTLQGLANSDIAQNEAICNQFRAAGCGSILELCKKINSDPAMMWLLGTSESKNIIADLITEYLKPNDDDDDEIVIDD